MEAMVFSADCLPEPGGSTPLGLRSDRTTPPFPSGNRPRRPVQQSGLSRQVRLPLARIRIQIQWQRADFEQTWCSITL